jgi:hypothetical protein
MGLLTTEQQERAKELIYRQGRLLERQLHRHFFEQGPSRGPIHALAAYQNADGGFGNGIEPDLRCPASSGIGAETALVTLDWLDIQGGEMVEHLMAWIAASVDERGVIPHPPAGFSDYPHQPWWEKSDDYRILGIAGLLAKWGWRPPAIMEPAQRYYASITLPDAWNVYDYPYYVYVKYAVGDSEALSSFVKDLPAFLDANRDHYPLFGRHWYHAWDDCPPELLEREAERVSADLEEDGGLPTAYPELPWWRPIMTLDALILLKRAEFLPE